MTVKHASTQAKVCCYFLSLPVHLIACCTRVHCVAAWIIHLCWRRVPLMVLRYYKIFSNSSFKSANSFFYLTR